MSAQLLKLLATAPRGFADLLAAELRGLEASEVRERSLGVAFLGSLETAYRACLESRVASRVFLEIAHVRAATDAAYYEALTALPWVDHVDPDGTLACDFSGKHPAITNSAYGAVRTKDAICDALRRVCGRRPDVSNTRPSVRVHAHARGADIVVSIDLSGEGLHRRGYRVEGGEAPLRENVAAGLLLRAGWPAVAATGGELLDPLCGSGTIAIEGALIAAQVAPGLRRDYFGFLGWKGHDAAAWENVRAASLARVQPAAQVAARLCGSDIDPGIVQVARANAARAGVDSLVFFSRGALADARPLAPSEAVISPAAPADGAPVRGLLCTNPPYGIRLQDTTAARALHRELGAVLRDHFNGWRAAILTGASELGLEIGLRAHRTHTVWNGAIEGRLLRIEVGSEGARELKRRDRSAAVAAGAHAADATHAVDAAHTDDAVHTDDALHADSAQAQRNPVAVAAANESLRTSPGARMFANRLAKNLKRLGTWARQHEITCYRLYDADMPEYAFAIDLYAAAESTRRWAYVQEYAAPREIEVEAVQRRRDEALSVLPEVLGLPADDIHLRMRRRTARGEQYDKQANRREFHVVAEAGLRFRVNFTDYLDTGLFLDHRLTRARLRAAAQRRRFLNLFAYTGSATVYAAAGRARSTTSVDLSRTYLDWAQENLALNGLTGTQHRFAHADCRSWLADAAARREQFDLVFLDPPTFSNSRRTSEDHDIQRDHVALIEACLAVLAPRGLLVFSTNAQRFRLDSGLTERHHVTDVSTATIPADFARNARIHQCFEITPT
jgi:23S rRNA (guanine2445-N2)-methyltransferase / 23S rRNA (guanine2069-N7)-methyltransferase